MQSFHPHTPAADIVLCLNMSVYKPAIVVPLIHTNAHTHIHMHKNLALAICMQEQDRLFTSYQHPL